jgi:hypothetical protein
MKSLIYKTKMQMVAELTGHISDATVQNKNNGVMLHTATNYLLK